MVNQAKEVGKNWEENLDSNMRSLANTARAACNLLSGEEKEQCEKGAENSGMTTQVFYKILNIFRTEIDLKTLFYYRILIYYKLMFQVNIVSMICVLMILMTVTRILFARMQK